MRSKRKIYIRKEARRDIFGYEAKKATEKAKDVKDGNYKKYRRGTVVIRKETMNL